LRRGGPDRILVGLLAFAAGAANAKVEDAREQGDHGQDYFCVLDRHPVDGLPIP
jgi:hypothetical protein